MPYYIRVLSPSEKVIPASELSRGLENCALRVEAGTNDAWEHILLAEPDGREIAAIERNVVCAGSLGEEELNEFLDEVDELQPASGAEWLKTYLSTIKTIYAFQVLGQTTESGWAAIGSLKSELWNALGGIFQADGEGFSNEDGYHIVWQFSERTTGPWWMGLLKNGAWVHFKMELGNQSHRSQFQSGHVPPGVKFATPGES
jgi:hypothetical protein